MCINILAFRDTAVSHSSTEAEFMSSEAGFRMEGIPALGSWVTVIDVLEPIAQTWCEHENINVMLNERQSTGS